MLGFIQQTNETVGCLCYTNVTGNFYKCMFIYIDDNIESNTDALFMHVQ
jgi:hypothetical protein